MQFTPGISTNSVVVVEALVVAAVVVVGALVVVGAEVVGADVLAGGPATAQVPLALEQLAYSEHKSAKSPLSKVQNSPGELPVYVEPAQTELTKSA
jgi:hypothetical protein